MDFASIWPNMGNFEARAGSQVKISQAQAWARWRSARAQARLVPALASTTQKGTTMYKV